MARERDDQHERERGAEAIARDARTGSAGAGGAGSLPREPAGGADASQVRGFFVRATERRVYVRPLGSSREMPGRSSGDAADPESGRGVARGYGPRSGGGRTAGGRSTRGYGQPQSEGPGGYYGQGTGEFDRGEDAYRGARDDYGRERTNRQARDRNEGPNAEGRTRHAGQPWDLRAGEGQWTRPGGYAELGQEREVEGYEPGYEQGEWSPGGDASVPLRMGYGDYGVRRHSARDEAARPRRWRREPVLARDIMTGNPNSVRPEASLREVARIMREENTGIVPVCDAGGTLLGVVTDRDIVMRTLGNDVSPDQASARDVMTDDVEAVTPDEELRDVVHLMGEHQVRRIPVVERGDRLVGIISMADVATRADFDEDLQDALEDISARRSFWSRLFR